MLRPRDECDEQPALTARRTPQKVPRRSSRPSWVKPRKETRAEQEPPLRGNRWLDRRMKEGKFCHQQGALSSVRCVCRQHAEPPVFPRSLHPSQPCSSSQPPRQKAGLLCGIHSSTGENDCFPTVLQPLCDFTKQR